MIEVRLGDLAGAEADAVLRPVSSDFSPVTPAMRRLDEAAGDRVLSQCRRIGDLPVGSAVITPAGTLAAEFIVHVAIRSPEENATPTVVRLGLRNGLRRLVEWELESVAVAPLGTGAGNLDAQEAAEVMVPLLADHIRDHPHPARVTIVVEDEYQRDVFAAAVSRARELAGSGP
ncbi:MAG TPA: macro domain-containing protein [Longimicrobiales bacterium]|nr:macro domain-containing protein [Longimicrobiales bacterium]